MNTTTDTDEQDEDTTCPDCGESPCHPQCLSGGGL